ncbi:hypothetical protein [Flavobacterium humi]|uniref:Uncharacterized protein n=1 Tax=Flavobacterium humi TaxID=2562683 RepID=A0A4Z0L9H4_9FLAO|nr:hypothetical protein [Flavobacterium humi]TGD58939.1 hypothetical protein E4635_03545 [Flavobacterium humi]
MKTLTWLHTISFSTLFALGTFLIGTMLFLYYILFPSQMVLVMGFLYVVAAFFFNLIILMHLISRLIFAPFERTENTIRILILLSNIPIAFLYFDLIINHN